MNLSDAEVLQDMLDVRLGAQPTGRPHLSSITVKMSADAIAAIDRYADPNEGGRSGYVRAAVAEQLKRDMKAGKTHAVKGKAVSCSQPSLGFEDGAAESRSKPPF